MFEMLKKRFKELKWRLKKHKKPSLFDLNYTSTEDPSGKPFATPERIAEYISLGADIHEKRWNKKQGRNLLPLHLAYENDNYKAQECLLKNGAAEQINDEWLDSLIENPELKSVKKELLAYRRQRMKNALLKLNYHTATKADIDRLIEKGADVNACVNTRNSVGKIEKEKTAIFYAIEAGNYEAFHQLVVRGANLTVRCGNSFPSEVARYACIYKKDGNEKIFDWFKKNKEFIKAIEEARVPNVWIRDPNWDLDRTKPLSMQRNTACLGMTPALTQNYVSERGTYRFCDYEKKKEPEKIKKQVRYQESISVKPKGKESR